MAKAPNKANSRGQISATFVCAMNSTNERCGNLPVICGVKRVISDIYRPFRNQSRRSEIWPVFDISPATYSVVIFVRNITVSCIFWITLESEGQNDIAIQINDFRQVLMARGFLSMMFFSHSGFRST